MSYITYVPLNTYRPNTRKLLLSRQVAHATVMQSFPPSTESPESENRILWRIDFDGNKAGITIVSPDRASVDHIVENCGWSAAADKSHQQVDYSPLLGSISKGDRYRFTIVLNTVVAVTGGKRTSVAEEKAADWSTEKLSNFGMNIEELILSEYAVESFKRGASKVTLAIAKVTGTMVVDDVDAVTKALNSGVGRAKGYGCGLLTLDEKIS